LRNSRINSKKIPEEALVEFFHAKRAGYSDRTAARMVFEKGYRDIGKDGKEKPFHYNVLAKRTKRIWTSLVALYPSEKAETSFDRFFAERIRITDSTHCGLSVRTITEEYRGWCERKGEPTVSKKAQGLNLKKRGRKRVQATDNILTWKGIVFVE
jgi:hypothetical protein